MKKSFTPKYDASSSSYSSSAEDFSDCSSFVTPSLEFPDRISFRICEENEIETDQILDDLSETGPRHVQFRNPISKKVVDDPSSSSLLFGLPLPPSQYVEPLLTAGDDDPLPAITDLQISGEPYPGNELQACGFSANGTTSCYFEWVRQLEDGTVNYIDGAKQPNYLVTADDVDFYLAVEVHPFDEDRNLKGEIVKVFANDNRKIHCVPEMQANIEKTILLTDHASYKVSLAVGFLHIWEAATLFIKREGYSIKCNDNLTIAEKFSASTAVTIPFGKPAELVITGSDGIEHSLRVDKRSTELSCSRDEIVLTLRLFIMKALRRKKGKKRVFLFNK